MAASAPDGPSGPPRAAILLPPAFLLHLVEEWLGGFPAWTLIALGNEVSPERFVLLNATALLLFGIGTLAAFHCARMAWFAASLAALVGLNGVLHTLATLGLGYYSPGTVTGVLLYLPLSAIVLRSSAALLPRAVFAGSVVFGVLLHGIAALLAYI